MNGSAVPQNPAMAPRVLFAAVAILVGAVTAAVVVLDVLAADVQVPDDAFLDPGWLTAVTALAQLPGRSRRTARTPVLSCSP